MAVGTYSLITLEDYKSYAGIENSQIERDAISLYSDDGTAATVAKSGNTLTLAKTGGTGTGQTIDLTLAANNTLAKLAAVIDGYAGWTANLIGWGSAASTELKNISATNCLLADNEVTLKFYDNFILEKLIDRASVIIEDALHRKIKNRTFAFERHDGSDGEIFLENFPVTEIIQICCGTLEVIRVKCQSTTCYNAYVSVDHSNSILKLIRDGVEDGSFDLSDVLYDTLGELAAAINAVSGWEAVIMDSGFSSWPSSQLFDQFNKYCANEDTWLEVPDEPLSGYRVDKESGIIELSCDEGFQNVFVSYKGGFSAVPDSIIQGCCRFVAYLDNLRERDESLSNESEFDYRWGAADLKKALSPDQMTELMKYKRWNV